MARRRFSSDEPTRPEKMRQPPLRGHRLGGEALAAALHAEQQQALGLGQPELPRGLAERAGTAGEPALEVVQSADTGQALLGRVVLEQPALADDLPLLLQDELDVVHVQAVVGGHRLGEGVLRLGDGEAEGGLDELLALTAVELHGHPLVRAQRGHDLAQELAQLVEGGKRDVQHGDVLLQLHRDVEHGGQQDHGRVGRLELLGQLAQRADDDRVVQERVEVLEDDQRGIGQGQDGAQGVARVPGPVGRRAPARPGHLAQPAGDRPGAERLAVVARQLLEDGVQPLLLP
jgi:hypothetical protein